MKKIKFSVLVCLIALGLSVGVYNAKAAMTNTEVQTLITAFGSMGLTQAQLTNMINILQGMVTSSAVNNTAPVISSANSLGSVANVASGISDPPRGTGTDNIAPVSSSANSIGFTLTPIVYSVTVDYSKTVDQLLTALNIPKANRSIEFNLGLFQNNTGTGQKNLDFQTIRTADLFPGVNGLLTYNPVSISDIYSKMHEKGYRPATFQEFLTVAVKYPQLLQANIAQAFGSLIKISSLEKINVTGVDRYYKYFIPYVLSGKVGLSGFGPVNANGVIDYDKINLNISSPFARALWFVVRDSSSPVSVPISLDALPSTVAKGSNGYFVNFTGEKYPVTVDYDKVIPISIMSAHDIATLHNTDTFVGAPVFTGTANVNIEFINILGKDREVADYPTIIRSMIAASPQFVGYRFATARELYAFSLQYTDKFNKVMAFGSYNSGCDSYPWIIAFHDYTEGVAGVQNKTGVVINKYSDMNLLNTTSTYRWTCIPTKDLGNNTVGYSADDMSRCTIAIQYYDWKFALVKLNP